jgi:Cyclic nucleotide-binding domain.
VGEQHADKGAHELRGQVRRDAFYLVVKGEVGVTRELNELAKIQPGGCFGEMVYFARRQGRRNTTVTARSKRVEGLGASAPRNAGPKALGVAATPVGQRLRGVGTVPAAISRCFSAH